MPSTQALEDYNMGTLLPPDVEAGALFIQTASSFPGVKQTEISLCIFRACKMKAKETDIAVPLNVTVPYLEI